LNCTTHFRICQEGGDCRHSSARVA
jgi:hypothetical protein